MAMVGLYSSFSWEMEKILRSLANNFSVEAKPCLVEAIAAADWKIGKDPA
jgi:hypothetical protein